MSEKEMRALRAENRRLRRENEYLRGRLMGLGEKQSARDPVVACFGERACMASAVHKTSYSAYLLHRLRMSVAFRLFDKTRFAVRGFFLATKLRDLLVWLFVLFGFGTRFLLFAGIFAVFIPALLLVSLFLAVLRFFAHRKWGREISAALSESGAEKYYLLFVRKGWEKRQYFAVMTSEMERDGMVFLISDSFAASGFHGMKKCSPHSYVIHISYYFALKKLLHGRLVQIY